MRLLLLSALLAGCAFAPSADDSPLRVSATNGTASAAPVFSWTPTGATSLWVTDPDDRSVWGIEAGGRTTAGRYERVLLEAPVPYGAFPGGEDDGQPHTTTAAQPLRPGTTYTVHVTYLGGGSGGFTGRRPIVRQGSATFTVSSRIDP